MSKKLSFIEEAEFRGFRYRPGGILGNGFYGNGMFITLGEMEKYSKTYNSIITENPDGKVGRIDPEFFIECENTTDFYTNDIVKLFPDLKEHDLHNFLNRFRDVFLSQKLFSINNRKRVFTVEAVKFIYTRLVKKEEGNEKKKGKKADLDELD